jgi:hypothetical protein
MGRWARPRLRRSQGLMDRTSERCWAADSEQSFLMQRRSSTDWAANPSARYRFMMATKIRGAGSCRHTREERQKCVDLKTKWR